MSKINFRVKFIKRYFVLYACDDKNLNFIFIFAEPIPECTQNSECSNDKTCFNQKCVDPCTLDSCGLNSRCHVQMHRAICICNDGYTGYPQQYCHQRA